MAMTRLEIGFPSETLGLRCTMTVLMPNPLPDKASTQEIPVLWLLHGLSDDHTMWERMTAVERYADRRGLAVVMPAVGRSFYTNMRNPATARYFDFIADEVPSVVRSLLPVSARREKNFVAGLSMGGYGAMKLALRHPERYAFAASLSGAVDMRMRSDRIVMEAETPFFHELISIFGRGDDPASADDDLFELAVKRTGEGALLPFLMLACGSEDFLYADNLHFRDHLTALDISHTFDEEPGTHEWGFWDRWIHIVIDRLPLD